MKYGVYIEQRDECWMNEFDTFVEAAAEIARWRALPKPKRRPSKVLLVIIIEHHEEGDMS